MSWQAYVDSNLLGSRKIARAAIHGHDGSLWATSEGFSLSTQEINEIIAAFNDPSAIQANGIHANGVKYFALTVNNRSIYGKKGADGIVAVKTKQAVLIGVYIEGTQPGEANTTVEGLADYLIGVGY